MRSKRERASSPRALGRRARSVWVDLRVLYPSAIGSEVLPDGLNLDEVVPGGLWEWLRSSTGEWLGVVSFHVTYRDGRPERVVAERQLVPAHAIRPR